ncbi:DUF397 domain-containing protein [Streptomyces sp. ISL-11]|uniref:DUF397 domain-containing protein n=1 Tax=Streptomyces sp. ISL-11 TaxID=2819174 RepID=UPI001BEB71C1|nr:DUF397 domain-containing protein [Streptomyces sp. ISL-11]MBT2383387.1 DUF397 domain-containing protein [Streptomyces sp. ISL-11]
MSTPDIADAVWVKSTYSGGNEGQCLEVAENIPGTVPVRDSKHLHRPPLLFPAPAWAAFVTALRQGELRP